MTFQDRYLLYTMVIAALVGFSVLPIGIMSMSPVRETSRKLNCTIRECDTNSSSITVVYQNLTSIFYDRGCDNYTTCFLLGNILTSTPIEGRLSDGFITGLVILVCIVLFILVVLALLLYMCYRNR